MMQFDDWWSAEGQYLDPDTSDVPWFDKRRGLAAMAFNAGAAYVSGTAQTELVALARQTKTDLDAIHAEICKLQGLDQATQSWPVWSSPSHTLAWCDRIISSYLSASKAVPEAPVAFGSPEYRDYINRHGHEPDRASPPKTYEGPKVKALEWVERTSPREDGPAEPTGDWEGHGILGAAYFVYIFDDHYEVTREDGEFVENHLGDLDEAKAAAQADYEKRVLPAIIPGKTYEDRLREAARMVCGFRDDSRHEPMDFKEIAARIEALIGAPK